MKPRMLLIKLSDGYTKATALELDSISGIHANCPPGTKVKISGPITVKRGKILLNNSNFTYLGGQVDQLLEVWQANLNAVKVNEPSNYIELLYDVKCHCKFIPYSSSYLFYS